MKRGWKREWAAKPLSARQKAVLCQLAGRAFVAGAAAVYRDVREYRHAVVFDVCGREGLTACTQLHYVPLYNAFALAAGAEPIEDRTVRSGEESALLHIRDLMERFELNEAYVRHVLADRLSLPRELPYGLPWLAGQLYARCGWGGCLGMFSTLCNRGRAQARRAEAEHGLPRATELHAMEETVPPVRLAEALDVQCSAEPQVRRRDKQEQPVDSEGVGV